MAADDITSKLDQVLLGIGQLSQRCDRMDQRMDALGGKMPELGEPTAELPEGFGIAKRLAADTARYTKYGSATDPGFGARGDSVDPIQAMTLEAQELRAKLRNVEQAQKNFVQNMRPPSAEEEAEMREFQARADDVYHAAGDDVRCPAPMSYERPSTYKTRILTDLARHSPTWSKGSADGGLEALDPKALNVIGGQIMDEAKASFKRGDHWSKDILAPHVHVADDGTRITSFTGPIFLRQFAPPRRVMRLRTQKEILADQMRPY